MEFKILIVEDDIDARSNMQDILSLDDFEVKTANSCLEAIRMLDSETFDAVIVDWKLPDTNADHLIPIIVEHLPQAPVIVVTGFRDFDASVTALRKGAYDFLLKPVNPDALRGVLARVVERREHIRKIQDAQEKLVINERLAAIGQMVAGLAHESRNAFQRSHACLATLSLDVADMPESLEMVKKTQRALDDLHFLLEEVRVYSAPIVLNLESSNLKSMIRNTWQQIMAAKPSDDDPHLECHIAKEFPSAVVVDQMRMRQVVRNILENARFACSDSGKIKISLAVLADQRLEVRFDDDGGGIESEQLETIFDPFFTTKTKGTGLGLAISRRIVEAHGGQLVAGNNEMGGASFSIIIPSEPNKHRD